MDETTRIEFKRDLANRLLYFPLLRLLIFSFWSRVAFAGFFLFLVFLALFLPKIWRATPPGVLPEIKISGLDVVQAWSLKRSALRSAAAGHYEDAASAWGGAVLNHPGDADLVRGALRNILQIERLGPNHVASAVWQTGWLLQLTRTNRTDVALAAQVCDKLHLYESVLRLLTPVQDRLTEPEEALLLKALFHSGQIEQFADHWRLLSDRLAQAPEMQLYHAAHLAGWGPAERMGEGRELLARALEDPVQRVIASRLQLVVAAQREDADAYRTALDRLDRWQASTLMEHALYWQLLAEVNRKDEAIALARAYANPPATAGEAVHLAEAYVGLGLKDEALVFLQNNTRQFGNLAPIWIAHANLLAEAKRWEDLRVLALQIRQQDGVRDTLAGYSYYLEGRAELELKRQPLAETAFEHATRHPFDNSALALGTANGLLKVGYPTYAQAILLPLERDLKASPEYWRAVFAAAFETRDSALLLSAALRCYELQPANAAAVNNYAAALILNRTRPEEAVKLTLSLIQRFPDTPAAKFNHALALLLNRRTDEADTLLSSIVAQELSPREQASWQMARFEASLQRKEYDKARELSEHIDVKYLFPNQVRWLDEARQQVRPRSPAR